MRSHFLAFLWLALAVGEVAVVVGSWLFEGPTSRMRRSLAWAPAFPRIISLNLGRFVDAPMPARCPMHDAGLPVNGVLGGK